MAVCIVVNGKNFAFSKNATFEGCHLSRHEELLMPQQILQAQLCLAQQYLPWAQQFLMLGLSQPSIY